MAGSQQLTFNITTKDEQTLAALRRIQAELKQTGNVGEASTKKAAKAGLDLKGALAGVAIGAGAKFALDEANQAQQTAARTAAVIKSTGNAAGVSAKQQDDYVQALSKTAAVDDEVIAGGANLLRTFTNIKGQAFQPALAAALDLSAAMGTDLQGSIVQVGKALNDPVKGITALTRVGVSFTAQQKEQIKSMVQAGDTAGAQTLILGELQKEFGGSAKAMATDSAKAKVAIGNAAESIGTALAPAVQKGATAIEFLSGEFTKIPSTGQAAIITLGSLAVAAPKVAKGFGEAKVSAANFAEKVGGAGTASIVGGSAVVGLSGAVWAFSVDAQRAAERSRVMADTIKSIRDEAESTGKSIASVFRDQTLTEFLVKNRDDLDAMGVSTEDLTRAVMGSHQGWEDFLETLAHSTTRNGEATAALSHTRHGLQDLRGELTGARVAAKTAADVTKELGTKQDETGDKTASLTDKLKFHAAALDGVNKATQEALASGFDEFAANQAYQESVSGVTEAEAELKLIRKAGDKDKIRDAEKKLNDAIEGQVEARGKQVTATEKANGRELTAVQLAQIQKAELEKLTTATGFQSDALDLLVIRLTQTRDRANEATTALSNMEAVAHERDARGGAAAPGTPGSAIPPTRNPDRKSAAVIVHGDLNLGGVHGIRDLKMALNQHAAQQDAKTARQVMTG